MEQTAGEGGLRSYTASLGIHPEAMERVQHLKDSLLPQDWETLVQDTSLVLHGRDYLRSLAPNQRPRSKVIALRERGLKVRVITKSPAGLHYLGHVARKRLLAALRSDPNAASPLVGVSDEEIIGHFVGACGDTCVSTDLTRASDLLPLDLLEAVVDGLEDSKMFTPLEIKILRVLTGPQCLEYPDGRSKIEQTTRGILMGLPTTWGLLSLIHQFWWTDAIKSVCVSRRVPFAQGFADNRFMTCGDDALFIGWHDVSVAYSALVCACGGIPSEGKHFVQVGDHLRGVFLERLYTFSKDSAGRVSFGERSDTLPLRGLVRPDLGDVKDVQELGPTVQLDDVTKVLIAVDSVWRQHPTAERRLARFCERAYPYVLRVAKSLGFLNGTHLGEGGSGIPLVGGPSQQALSLKARSLLARSQGITFPSVLRGEISSTWKMASMLVDGDLAEFQREGQVVYQSGPLAPPAPQHGAPYVACGTREDFVRAAVADSYSRLALSLPDRTRRPRLNEQTLRRTIREWKQMLPAIPNGMSALDIVNGGPTLNVVWVRRTRGPGGELLYPQWVGEARASRADLRSRALRNILD